MKIVSNQYDIYIIYIYIFYFYIPTHRFLCGGRLFPTQPAISRPAWADQGGDVKAKNRTYMPVLFF